MQRGCLSSPALHLLHSPALAPAGGVLSGQEQPSHQNQPLLCFFNWFAFLCTMFFLSVIKNPTPKLTVFSGEKSRDSMFQAGRHIPAPKLFPRAVPGAWEILLFPSLENQLGQVSGHQSSDTLASPPSPAPSTYQTLTKPCGCFTDFSLNPGKEQRCPS